MIASDSKSNITITNDKGRLTQDEIDRMTKEAELYEQEDKEFREFTESKNALEAQLFQMKSTLGDNSEDGNKMIDEFLNRVGDCSNKEDVDALQKELMEKAQEISKAAENDTEQPSVVPESGGPTIEEVD